MLRRFRPDFSKMLVRFLANFLARSFDQAFAKVLTSLVLHQCPIPVKKSILANAFRLLKPGGMLLIADYGRQRSVFMKLAFNLVRLTDGFDDTRANKDGRLPDFMLNAGFSNVQERSVTLTPTGSISG